MARPLPSPPTLNLNMTMTPVDALVPYAQNARRHPARQIRKIENSIREFGFVDPLLTDGKNNVLCGHGALEAAKRAGLTMVPTIQLSHLTPAQMRALIIAHNALAEKSSWARNILKSEIQGLIELGYDAELTGFDTVEIDTLLNIDDSGAGEADAELVELPDDVPPVSRTGDHWKIGRQNLVHADARTWSSFAELLAGDKAQAVFTDPPYNCLIAGNVSGLGEVRHQDFIMAAGELTDAEFTTDFLRPVFRNIVLACAPGAIAFVCSDWRAYPCILDAAAGVFHKQKNLITWAKTNAGMGSFYRSQTELILVFQVSKGPTINNFLLGQGGRHRSNLWTYAGCNTFRRGRKEDLSEHPTIKPRKLVADAILDVTQRNEIVLDPFVGSGTTLAACEVTGRRGFGLELDGRYCDVALRRLAKLTGETPRLIDGRSFDEVAGEQLAQER